MPDFTQEVTEVAIRFHRETEWYTVHVVDGVTMWRVRANSERAVELFFRLSAHLDAVVDVAITHARDRQSWEGALRFLPEVREAIGRLRWPLATYGGVEVTLVTAEDQLSLTPTLELVIYARRNTWSAHLDAEGVFAREVAPPAQWRPDRVAWVDAPELSAALAATVERLALEDAR